MAFRMFYPAKIMWDDTKGDHHDSSRYGVFEARKENQCRIEVHGHSIDELAQRFTDSMAEDYSSHRCAHELVIDSQNVLDYNVAFTYTPPVDTLVQLSHSVGPERKIAIVRYHLSPLTLEEQRNFEVKVVEGYQRLISGKPGPKEAVPGITPFLPETEPAERDLDDEREAD